MLINCCNYLFSWEENYGGLGGAPECSFQSVHAAQHERLQLDGNEDVMFI